MAGLRKLKGKYYSRIWYKNDKGKRKEKVIPLHTKSKRRANNLNKEIEKQEKAFKQGIISLDDIRVKPPSDLDQIIDDFLHYLKVNDRSPKTVSLYRLALDTFSEIFQDKDIELLGKQDYTEFLSKMKKRYPCNTTCNIRLRSVRAFLNWCKDTDRIKKVPFDIKQLPTKNKKPRYFSDREMEIILDKASNNKILYARIYVHWKTGLRLRELSDSYYKNDFIKTFDAKKNGMERSIPIDKKIRDQYFIAKDADISPGHISREFTDLLKELNLYKTRYGDTRHFHNLRHTFAVRIYFQTRDIYRVKVLLGHSSVKTTEKYANFDLAELDRDFNISDNTLKNCKYVNPNNNKKAQRKESKRLNKHGFMDNFYGMS